MAARRTANVCFHPLFARRSRTKLPPPQKKKRKIIQGIKWVRVIKPRSNGFAYKPRTKEYCDETKRDRWTKSSFKLLPPWKIRPSFFFQTSRGKAILYTLCGTSKRFTKGAFLFINGSKKPRCARKFLKILSSLPLF